MGSELGALDSGILGPPMIIHGHLAEDRTDLPSGKRLHNYGKSPFLTGKLTISIAIFNG